MSVCDPILSLSHCLATSSHEDLFELLLPEDPKLSTVLINLAAFVKISSMTFAMLGFMSEPESILPL